MNAKHLILSLFLALAASAAVAAFQYAHVEPASTAQPEATAIPRVVVVGRRTEG